MPVHGNAVVKSRVLLVEDSKFLRLANERALSKAGFNVTTAADGEEAVQIANDKLPDIVLLDMLLPKLSGPEVLRILKASPVTMHIPVIVLSSLSQKNEGKLLGEGAAAYFEKSSLGLDKNSDGLAAMIEAVLARVESARKPDPGSKARAAKAGQQQ
jgi:CheY-like chemotaxis protein